MFSFYNKFRTKLAEMSNTGTNFHCELSITLIYTKQGNTRRVDNQS